MEGRIRLPSGQEISGKNEGCVVRNVVSRLDDRDYKLINRLDGVVETDIGEQKT